MGSSESKSVFRSRIQTLTEHPIVVDDHDFWKPMLLTAMAAEDVYAALSPSELRALVHAQPMSLAAVLFKCIEQLFLFVQTTISDFTSARNCLFILARLMPFVLEKTQPLGESDSTAASPDVAASTANDFVENFFWFNRVPTANGSDHVFSHVGDVPLQKPLGQLLMETLLDVAFYPDFTFIRSPTFNKDPQSSQDHPFIDPRLLWAGGCGAHNLTSIQPSTRMIDEHRVDVLHCILSCFSGALFETSGLAHNRFVECLLTGLNNRNVTFAYSLVNTIFSYNPAGKLPYTSYMGTTRESLVELSLAVFIAGLDYSQFTYSANPDNRLRMVVSHADNHAFWYVLRFLKNPVDLKFIYNGFVRLLGNRVQAARTYFPMSQKPIECVDELLLCLWKLLDANPEFLEKICTECDPTELVVPLLFCVVQTYDEHSKFGTLQAAVFILLAMSENRNFGVALNKPLTETFPAQLPAFTGSHADLLILVFHKVLTSNRPWLRPVLESVMAIFCSISLSCTSLCTVSASKLVSVFATLSSPKRLASFGVKGFVFVNMFVEMFADLTRGHFQGNAPLVYNIICQRRTFDKFREHLDSLSKDPEASAETQRLATRSLSAPATQTLFHLIEVLNPMMEEFCQQKNSASPEDVYHFLRRVDPAVVFPVTPSENDNVAKPFHLTRSISHNRQTHSWIATWVWGTLYLHVLRVAIPDTTNIRLFRITVPGRPQQQASQSGADGVNKDTPPLKEAK